MAALIIFLVVMILLMPTLNAEKRRQEAEKNKDAPRNIPLQYAYTLDEWYKLRLEFDALIEEDWQKYKIGEITREEYYVKSITCVKSIIEEGYRTLFGTLYAWGVRKAAIRMSEEGYAPGMVDPPYKMSELNWWRPRDFQSGGMRAHWKTCIPTMHSFLTMYPDPKGLENMGCGVIAKTGWEAKLDLEAPVGLYYAYDGHIPGGKEERIKAMKFFQERGYDGKTYTKMPPRDFGDLTEDEILKKYEFVINDKFGIRMQDSYFNSSFYNYKRTGGNTSLY